jgi:hypothetical protein
MLDAARIRSLPRLTAPVLTAYLDTPEPVEFLRAVSFADDRWKDDERPPGSSPSLDGRAAPDGFAI